MRYQVQTDFWFCNQRSEHEILGLGIVGHRWSIEVCFVPVFG